MLTTTIEVDILRLIVGEVGIEKVLEEEVSIQLVVVVFISSSLLVPTQMLTPYLLAKYVESMVILVLSVTIDLISLSEQ